MNANGTDNLFTSYSRVYKLNKDLSNSHTPLLQLGLFSDDPIVLLENDVVVTRVYMATISPVLLHRLGQLIPQVGRFCGSLGMHRDINAATNISAYI